MNSDPKPPETGTTHTLPFDKLSAEAFERLTLWLVRREGFEHVQHLGETGSEQGRDILAWKEGKRFAFQCKRVKAFSAAEGEAEIRKLRDLEADEQPREVVFVLPIALRAATRKAIWKAWGDEPTCHFWVGNELDERAKRFPDLVEQFFQIPVEVAKPSLSETLSGVTSIPNPPVHYLAREEALAALRAKLLVPGSTRLGITSPRQAVGVQGMGGIGKSVLAAALAQENEVKAAFPDGIFWVAVGRLPDLRRLQIELAMAAGKVRPNIEKVHQGKLLLSRLLRERAVLVVLDDLWSLDDAEAFNVLGPRGRLLITTRNTDLLVGLGAEEFRVEVLTPKAALGLLVDWAGTGDEIDRLPPEAAKVARRCGYLPLALAMIGAMIRLRPTAWSDALERLDYADLGKIRRNFPDYPYPDLLRALAVSVEALAPEERERYMEFAVFPEEALIPEATLETLWASSGLSALDARDLAAKLVARSLAQPAGKGLLRVHDLQADYLRHEIGDQRPLHLRLVEAYSARCAQGFASGPNDGYYFQNLANHLVLAGRADTLRKLLLDHNWMEAKLTATNIYALLADYEALLHDAELRLVQNALRLSAHVVAEHPEELVGQLLGRLLGRKESGIVTLLEGAHPLRGCPWLRPLSACLIPPGGGLLRTLTGHADSVSALASLSDGRVVSCSYDNTLRVWDAGSGKTLRILEGHSDRVCAVAVLPNGRVVSGSWDKTIRVWDVSSGKTLKIFEGHSGAVSALAVLPDGRVVSGSLDLTLQVWDVDSEKIVSLFGFLLGMVTALAALPDGRVVSATFDGPPLVLDVDSGKTLILEAHPGHVFALAILSDGRVVSGSSDGTLRVLDVGSGKTLRILEGSSSSGVYALAALPGGRIVSGSWDRTLQIWHVDSHVTIRTLGSHLGEVKALAVLPDGRVVSGSKDQTLRIWDAESSEMPRTPEGLSGAVISLAILPDGQIVSSSRDKMLRLLEAGSGKTLRTFEGEWGTVMALAVLPEGRVVSGSKDKILRLLQVDSGKTLRSSEEHWGPITALAVLPDGRVVSGSADKMLRVWDVFSDERFWILSGHLDEVTALVVLPDGRVVSGSKDRTLRVWDVDSGETLMFLEGLSGAATALAVLPDGRVVAGFDDQTLRVWDLGTVDVLRAAEGHCGEEFAMEVLPDGRVVAGSEGHILRVWDVGSDEPLRAFKGHSGVVFALAILPGGRVVTSSDDLTLRVWDVDSGNILAAYTLDAASFALAALDHQDFVVGDATGRLQFFRLQEPG